MLGQRRDVQPMKSKSVAAQCSSRPLSAGIWRVAPAPLSISAFSLLHVRSHHLSSIIILALRACLDATNTFSRGNEFHSLSVVHKKTEVSYFDPKSCCLGKGKNQLVELCGVTFQTAKHLRPTPENASLSSHGHL